MRKIKIISGVYGYRPAGSKYVEPKRAGDPPFTVEDEKATRLVAKKIAVYVDDITLIKEVATAIIDTEDDKKVDNPFDETKLPTDEITATVVDTVDDINEETTLPTNEITTPEEPVYNVDMKVAELREIMDECQLPFKVGMTKVDMVAALDEYFSDDADDIDELPVISAEDSIV